MINPLKIIMLFSSFCFSITFEIQNNSATINMDGLILDNPFSGGTNYARISWYDWDQDNDIDLFLLDEDLHFKYFKNDGDESAHNFILEEHPINSLSGINWFHLDDFNNDGNIDLASQSTIDPSHVMLYKFNGEDFEYVSLLYQENGQPVISAAVMTPTFADIDNDGDLDFFSGNVNGTVNYYNNLGLVDGVPEFEFISSFWQNILIVGPSQNRHGASAIRFIDLDGDQDLDLAWGDYFQRSLYIIWNIGTAEDPVMDPENFTYQYPEDDPIFTSGQNMPSFADLDGDSDMDLFITVLGGDGPIQLNDNFLMYENTGSSTSPDYQLATENFLEALDLLSDVVPEFIDINNDGYLDLFIGQDYTTDTSPTQGRIYYFENQGFEELTLNLEDSELLGTEVGLSLSPEFVDIDNDGDYDLFIGDYNGKINYYQNSGSPLDPSFVDQGFVSDIDLGFYSIPEFCDIDNDGDYDLFIGNYDGQIYFYENTGDIENYNFVESTFSINIEDSEYSRSAPRFVDLDDDNDFDLVLGTATDGVRIYWNIGNHENHQFVMDSCLEIPYFGYNVKPSIVDVDSSESLDIIVGVSTGGFLHYKMTRFSDLNYDNNVDVSDIIMIVSEILHPNDEAILCVADANHDGNLDIFDIVLIVGNILNL